VTDKKQNDKVSYFNELNITDEICDIASKYSEEEIPAVIASDSRYAINYAFSPVRKNLLDWYLFRKDCTILEVGAGMGALTGMLCTKAKQVVAVEQCEAEVSVIRKRYQTSENLTVVNDSILNYETAEQFDYVVMVGLAEYAAVIREKEITFSDFLARLKGYLKPDGVLLFAVENQFGLKYWLGCAEEYVDKPFAGIGGYKEEGPVRTFSKAALENMCADLGLNSRFYYVLPDYKFPTAVFTDQSLPTYHDARNPKYAYAPNSCLIANERELYRDVIQNDVFPFFANSYLVEASRVLPERQIVRVSARSEVIPQNRIMTVIDNQGRVYKIPQTKEAAQHIKDTYLNEQALLARNVSCVKSEYDGHTLKSEFCPCRMANEVFSDALEKGDVQTIRNMIDIMEAALRASSELCDRESCNSLLLSLGGGDEEEILLHGYMDMTFYNAFWNDGTLTFFDQEWDFPGLPLRFILYYGLKICYEQTNTQPAIPFASICEYIHVDDLTAQRYDQLEAMLWGDCFVRNGDMYGADGLYNQFGTTEFHELLETRTQLDQLKTSLATVEAACQQLQLQNDQLNKSLMAAEASCQLLEQREQDLQHELACREGECQQLRDKENQLKNDLEVTRRSRTWRLGRILIAPVRFLVPVGSKRALICRLLWTMVRHPVKFLRNLTPRKIKKFFRMLKNGGVEGAQMLVQSGISGEPAPSALDVVKPDIISVDLNPEKEKTAQDYPVLVVPQWDEPTVSIVIPVYNQFEFTYHCVESIIQNSGDVSYEIIIANDCSTDLTTQIDRIIPGVLCVTNEKNLRFLRNCNNAAKRAKGKYILFLNNDTQVQKNWLQPLVTLIESAQDIGMVGSKLIYPDGTLQEAGGILWRDGSAWNYGNRRNPAEPEFNYVKQVDYISGAAIMLSRQLWEEIGGFDELFAPAYCEDSDLAFTVRKMGYRVMYQPQSVVVHFEGVSNGTDTSSGQKKYQIENTAKFRKKWAEELAKHPENGENVFLARDYSYGKKTLLMVDHYVPHFDKDAGSRTVFQYLKMFVEQGFNVKFIGDNFYQHEPYTTALQQMGIEVLYGPSYAAHWKEWIRQNGSCIDYVFLNRPHIAPKYLEFIRQNTRAKIMYYGHDLAFLREMREFEITGDASFRDSAIEWQPKELSLMRNADMAYYPSYVEVDEIHSIDPTIRVKAIPAYLFENVKWEGYDFDNRSDIMFIGGFGHRPNVDAVKWLAGEVLPELLKYLPDIKIHILGSNAPKEVLELASEHLTIEGFVTDEELENFYRTSRIALVPLRYGAGIKGKVVEAMRYGTPVVTTSTGAEGIPNAQEAMAIEDDALMLAKRIAELYVDADKLTSMSKNSILYIQDNYSYDNAIKVIGPEFDLC